MIFGQKKQKIKKIFYKSVIFRLTTLVFFLAVISIFMVRNFPTVLGAADSELSFSPSSGSHAIDEDFTLDAVVDPGSHDVTVAGLRVTYDHTKLQLNNIVANTASFPISLAGATMPGDGTAYISVSTNYGVSVTSPTTVATFYFHALATVTDSVVTFATAPASPHSIIACDDEPGVNELGSVTASLITVTSTDVTAPTGGSVSYTDGNYTALSVGITAADGTDGESGIDTHSRTLQRHEGNFSGGTCATYGSWGTITPGGTYPNYTDTTIASGKCYQYKYIVADNAGNTAPYTSANVVKADNTAPAGGSITFTDGYYTSLSVGMTAADGTDSASGIDTSSRSFKRREATMTSGACGSYGSWLTMGTAPTGTYPDFADASVESGKCYQYQYLVSDNFANQATYTGANTAKVDTTAPSGGSISYINGYFTSLSIGMTAADGTDSGGSGINTASRIVEREEANLSGGTCGSYGSWSDITSQLSGTYPNYTDTYNLQSGKCYMYRYKVSDNAGSQTTYNGTSEVKTDSEGPTGGSITYTNGMYTALSVGLTAADGTDAFSGVNTSTRTFNRREAILSGTACGSYGSWGTITPAGTYPVFTDTNVTTNHCYQYRYLVSDNAGSQTTYTGTNTAQVDSTAPVISGETAPVISDVAATITWTTDEGATSQVEYGPTVSYGSTTTLDSSYATSHSQNITGLTANTTYHFRVLSSDGVPHNSTGDDHTFTTSMATVATPTADPSGDTYTSAQSVTLETSTSGADIYYTTDGSDPTASSTPYSSAIDITSSLTLKAIAIKSGMTDSAIMVEEYVIGQEATDADISRPKIKIDSEDKSFSHSKEIFSKSKTFTFKGGEDTLANGQIKVYKNDNLYKTVNADSSGDWSAKIKVSSNKHYKFKFHYYSSSDQDLGDSSSYTVKVDSKDPEFTDLPLILRKRAGDRLWWKAEDNDEINYYKYTINGKTVKTKDDFFIMPSMSWGIHFLDVSAYDKAGNKTNRRVMVTVI